MVSPVVAGARVTMTAPFCAAVEEMVGGAEFCFAWARDWPEKQQMSSERAKK